MKKLNFLFTSLFVVMVCTGLVFAQEKTKDAPAMTGFRAELVGLIDLVEGRYVQLAEAMPADKMNWKPGEGVRSFKEVLTHMIQANYGLPNFVGVKPPSKMPDMKKEMNKAEVIHELKKSFKHTKDAVMSLSDKDLEKATTFFGNKTTYRGVISFMNAHNNQHLGQLIAYARMNGVTPPWNLPRN